MGGLPLSVETECCGKQLGHRSYPVHRHISHGEPHPDSMGPTESCNYCTERAPNGFFDAEGALIPPRARPAKLRAIWYVVECGCGMRRARRPDGKFEEIRPSSLTPEKRERHVHRWHRLPSHALKPPNGGGPNDPPGGFLP